MSTLEQRLQRLEDIEAIRQLKSRVILKFGDRFAIPLVTA